ncbi:unnamed protein product [Thlaspi arvense]|uniref:Uncharacterized protein n=1 Tax=Thlaspi arvense TaxID=13288 RepID=A0AAU9RX08_THLAR|nr:unnamed protein product [Thlaspi arvense]
MKSTRMRNCKRPRVNHEREFYQTPTNCWPEEKIQRVWEFVKKLKTTSDGQRIFHQCVVAMKSYLSGSLTYMDAKQRVFSILRNGESLLEEFHQLLSDLASLESNSTKENAKSDVVRTVEFLNKVEALGEGVYKAFIGALAFPGDIDALVEQLEDILGDDASLKEEFKTFLIDSRLLKKPKRDSEAAATPVTEDDDWSRDKITEGCRHVTPSYWIRPDAEEGSSSDEVLNGRYFSVGQYDPEKVTKKKITRPRSHVEINKEDDKLLEEDRLLETLTKVIKFGKNDLCNKETCEMPPVGFEEFIQWFSKGRKVPEMLKTDPRRGLQDILPRLESMEKKMRNAKDSKMQSTYNRVNSTKRINVNK